MIRTRGATSREAAARQPRGRRRSHSRRRSPLAAAALTAIDTARQPQSLGVVVASNLFGDILDRDRRRAAGRHGHGRERHHRSGSSVPGIFEPVHGSAPDIVGRGIADPIGTIWGAAMVLDHLGLAAPVARSSVPSLPPARADRGPGTSAAAPPPPRSAPRSRTASVRVRRPRQPPAARRASPRPAGHPTGPGDGRARRTARR